MWLAAALEGRSAAALLSVRGGEEASEETLETLGCCRERQREAVRLRMGRGACEIIAMEAQREAVRLLGLGGRADALLILHPHPLYRFGCSGSVGWPTLRARRSPP